MDLKLKFEEADICGVIQVSEMEGGKRYLICNARRVHIRYGPSVLLTIEGFSERPVSVFLPKRYSSVFANDDICRIHSKRTVLHVIYKGTDERSKAYKMPIE
jgi:hypothetical protein